MLKKIWDVIQERKIDGYLISKRENVRYISGFTGRGGWLLLTWDKQFLIIPKEECVQAEEETKGVRIVCLGEDESRANCLEQLIKKYRIARLAVEMEVFSAALYRRILQIPGIQIEGLDGVLEEIRSIKTPEEIHSLRCACNIACRAFDYLLDDIRIGVTEKELEAKLSYYMTVLGGDAKPNFNLLLSGTRTSLLHGMPSAKSIQYGDLILMDFGIEYKGYTSDMTRVVVAGKATEEQKALYGTVNTMLDRCLENIRDGVKASDVCEASFRTIRGTKYEPHYYSSIGHGIGLFVHEIPFLRPTSTDMIRENQVMAVEPAIFIPGWGGIHLEDNILVTKDGCENLTSTEKRLIEL